MFLFIRDGEFLHCLQRDNSPRPSYIDWFNFCEIAFFAWELRRHTGTLRTGVDSRLLTASLNCFVFLEKLLLWDGWGSWDMLLGGWGRKQTGRMMDGWMDTFSGRVEITS